MGKDSWPAWRNGGQCLGRKAGIGSSGTDESSSVSFKIFEIIFLCILQFCNEITFLEYFWLQGKRVTLKNSIIFDLCRASKQQWQDSQMTYRIIIVGTVIHSWAAEGQEERIYVAWTSGRNLCFLCASLYFVHTFIIYFTVQASLKHPEDLFILKDISKILGIHQLPIFSIILLIT